MKRSKTNGDRNGFEVAVIGLACRFPKAGDSDQFWKNLCDGLEAVSFFTEQELRSSGIDPQILKHPNYVNAGSVLEDIEMFDSAFFGYSPREAEIMDPQHRLFLECAYHALENAGYNPQTYKGSIGVYAGAGMSSYLQNIQSNPDVKNSSDALQASISNDKDHLTTRIAYKLGLRGPSVTVQTACSTSLVAVQLAHQALLCGACDMALAGGVKIRINQRSGYFYQEGGIMSPDGHCRAFDAAARGTVGGSGVGIVVLKRLDDALADGDCIRAVIKGSAINNDGSSKVGYTAPSVEGQARVIRAAHFMAGVDPETITYIETHGTGTALGDPIEIAALTEAFRAGTQKKGFCAIGSLKTNIGHLDTAAGVAGLIKTVLALEHKQIPASLHFENPNPIIDFANSPLYVNAALREWKSASHPRRAGVSSFGIGGTNAHVVLEEAPPVEGSGRSRSWRLLVLSARSDAALDIISSNLAHHLKRHPGIDPADVEYTLQVGRKALTHRQVLVCRDSDDAVAALETLDPERLARSVREAAERPVAFMFPGQGSQYVNMGRELYEDEPAFREQVDICSELLKPNLGLDLRHLLYPDARDIEGASNRLKQTFITQPALFVIEYAMAKLWMSWGVKPQAMIGHSIGEYVAGCLAGVFSLEDALALVAMRGRLMQGLPEGAMLSVPLPEPEVEPLLGDHLSIASVNGPCRCVVSGPTGAIDELERRLSDGGVGCRRLHTSHAFHSKMMDPVLQSFTKLAEAITLKPPTIPYISNITGGWITAGEATDPGYWARHLRQAVRFGEGMSELLKEPDRILLEVGPGDALSTLVRRHPDRTFQQPVLSSMRHPDNQASDVAFLLGSLGRLWLAGKTVDWARYHAHARPHRLPLPTYPFERKRYWIERGGHPLTATPDRIEPQASEITSPAQTDVVDHDATTLRKKADIADWFYVPVWKQALSPLSIDSEIESGRSQCWLVFIDECGIGSQIAERLEKLQQDVITVRKGEGFTRLGELSYAINPARRDDYDTLLKEVHILAKSPARVVHLWSVTPEESAPSSDESLDELTYLSYYSLLFLTQALAETMPAPVQADQGGADPIQIAIVSNNMQRVAGEDALCPEKAILMGPCRVIPLEHTNIVCRSIDISLPEAASPDEEELIAQLIAEFSDKSSGAVVAYRRPHRWVQTFEPVRLDAQSSRPLWLREEGVYLITGGLGGIGLALAEYLAKTVRARLVLVGRSSFPEEEEWDSLLATGGDQDELSRKVRKLRELEQLGAEVMILSADVSDRQQMEIATRRAYDRFGHIDGVIHSAGIPPDQIIQRVTPEKSERVLSPKLHGTRVLDEIFKDRGLDFLALCSSHRSITGGFGASDYTAANAYLDAFARSRQSRRGTRIVSIIWDAWREVGMSVKASGRTLKEEGYGAGLSCEEGMDVFGRILRSALPEVVVSMHELGKMIEYDQAVSRNKAVASLFRPAHARPDLANPYVAPRNDIEATLADIWQALLGIDRVGVHDNFFELGGDSVISLRIISRANQAGIHLTPKQVFECQTIAHLATVANTTLTVQAEQGAVTGAIPLTPIQRWFFEHELASPHHWNQSVFLEVQQPLEPKLLERAFEKLLEHHDALRHRFARTPSGWQQSSDSAASPVALTYLDLSSVAELEQASAIEAAATRLQAGLNLMDGPLVRVGLLSLGENRPTRLLIVVHHLLIDIISWRILVEDMQTALQQLSRGEAIQLPPKTTSFKRWAERLTEHAQAPVIQSELDYWMAGNEGNTSSLPVDYPGGVNTAGSASTVSSTLTAEETRSLLQDVPKAYGTQIDDALLTALAQAFAEWTGGPTLLVDLEGHGREPIFEDVDLSRTVGWFTSCYPVRLELAEGQDAPDAILSIKDQLRRIPNGGIGYGLLRYLSRDDEAARRLALRPQPQVSFLYIGQSNQGPAGTAVFRPATESCGPKQDPRDSRQHLIDVIASASGGQLRVSWTYSENLHRRATIEDLSERFLQSLRRLISHCYSFQTTDHSAWDFPLIQLPQEELEKAFQGIAFEEV
jgi:non-ribosomal peptide synthase protein (TIGR01720 family)